jgi:hypothetical protein
MKRLICFFTFLIVAGLMTTAVGGSSGILPGESKVTANPDLDWSTLQEWTNLSANNQGRQSSTSGDLFVNSGQSLGNGASFSLAIGDLDGDGHLDVFVANGAAGGEANEVWLNNGLGLFSTNGQSIGNNVSHDVALGDVNGNGFLDAVVADQEGITIWLNDGAGQFSDSGQLLSTPGVLPQGVAVADLDGNGRLDIVVANVAFGGGGAPNSVWLNGANGDPGGAFSHSGQSIGNSPSRAVALADLNGNGYIDLFFIGQGPGEVWFNDGSAQFTDSGQTLSAGNTWQASLADLDGDGFADIFLARAGANEVWLNDSSGFFVDSGQRLGTTVSFDVSLADLTGNGALDAFVANIGSNKVWLNDGSGQFSDSGQNMDGIPNFSIGVGLADLNGNGRADAFVANDGPNQVWLNQSGTPLPQDGADLEVIVLGEKYRDLRVNPSTLVNFSVTVHNHGPELATGVIVQGSHSFFDASWGECATAWCDAWLFGDLPAGQSATPAYGSVFGVPANMGAVRYTATANVSVTSLEVDPNPGNNHSTFTTYLFDCGSRECSLEAIFCRLALPQSPNFFALRPLAANIIDLALYYLVRNVVLMDTADGQRYVDLYYTHDPEISALLEADAGLEAQAIATLQLWEPNLWALVTGQGAEVLITPEQVAAVDAFLDNLAAVASPELQQVIADERARLGAPEEYIGMTMSEARGLIVGYGVRLPFVSRD